MTRSIAAISRRSSSTACAPKAAAGRSTISPHTPSRNASRSASSTADATWSPRRRRRRAASRSRRSSISSRATICRSYDHAHRVHLAVEAMRRAYRDRAEYLGDPDFVQMPIAQLTSLDYAAGLRASIHPDKATPSDMLPGYLDTPQGVHTSHFSIIDKDGNLVSANADGEPDLRLGVRRAGHRLRAQRRDGRFRARRRQAECVRPGRQRQQRAQAAQPAAVVDVAELRLSARTASACSARPAAAASSR